MLRRAAMLSLSCAALASAGCGGGEGASTAGLRVQREDLIAVSHALLRAQSSVERAVTASKAAWPLVANGLPAALPASGRATIATAAGEAAKVIVPAPLPEAQSTTLTGPAAQLAGLYQSFSGLAKNGWRMVGAAIDAREHGSPAAARFARANVALYIESVYDAHFSLAQIGKKLASGYGNLGGAAAFGSSLTGGEARALGRSYSEAADRLHPHVGVRLGS
ncbi:MAG TPA: hypothetical protein VGH78_03880 [Solirubrobacteraceae bacterium]